MVGLVRKGWFGNLVLLVLALSLFEQCNCESKGFPMPPICAKVECPKYEVIESHKDKDFEIRTYKEAMWVFSPRINSTDDPANEFQVASTRGFSFLFAYINGQNNQSAIVNMTSPILTEISLDNDANRYYASGLYLPQNYQNTPPKSEFIRPVKLPAQPYAAVVRFSGPADFGMASAQHQFLKGNLYGTSWEAAVNGTTYSVASYNSLCEKKKLVNEVIIWFTKK